jgi:hypothetical protein
MEHINLDKANEQIKTFIRFLAVNPNGSVLELEGKLVVQVLPVAEQAVDEKKLRQAIKKRRNQSRVLSQDWDHADREMWRRIPGEGE